MSRYFEYIAIFILLFAGMLLMLVRTNAVSNMRKTLERAKASVDEADKQIKLLRRKNLSDFESKNSVLIWMEKQLEYSGFHRRFQKLTVGRLLVANIVLCSMLIFIGSFLRGAGLGLALAIAFVFLEGLVFQIAKSRNNSIVNDELPKFLDFLGNYSITNGELTSVLSQISKYVREPLKGVLEECEMESRVTGDVSMAIVSMADKIEHPQFKQLARNIEVTVRYSADFTSLVSDSRRSMREYLSQSRERSGMLREAGINMILLLIMSVVVLLTVNLLIDGSVWAILFGTFVGHLALAGMAIIIILFAMQALSMNK